jgi:hypothetical protein
MYVRYDSVILRNSVYDLYIPVKYYILQLAISSIYVVCNYRLSCLCFWTLSNFEKLACLAGDLRIAYSILHSVLNANPECCDNGAHVPSLLRYATPANSKAEALTQTEQRVRRIVDDEKSVPGIQHLVVDAEHTVSAVCHGRLDMGHEHELVRPQTRFMA